MVSLEYNNKTKSLADPWKSERILVVQEVNHWELHELIPSLGRMWDNGYAPLQTLRIRQALPTRTAEMSRSSRPEKVDLDGSRAAQLRCGGVVQRDDAR